uniref:Uncharacterized protein n=1 Tax=Romanomermis culicivorax TaxID=13658 RepID=A0A915HFM3_ROMCU
MVKRGLQENHDFKDADFSLLLQNFNENFLKLLSDQSTADVLPILNKKIADSCSNDRLDAYLSFVAHTALDKNLLVVATVTPDGGRPSLNTPQYEMVVEDQIQAGDAPPAAKMPRTDDVVNGESYDEHDLGRRPVEPMDVTPTVTENIQTAVSADVTLASVNIHFQSYLIDCTLLNAWQIKA